MLFVAAPLALLSLLLSAGFIRHIYFDRSGLPDIERFIRFEPPTTGKVYDARGKVLIELAREYRRVVSYDEVPVILRQAVLAAEDKNFFSHSGVEYRALPRVVQKTVVRSLAAWRKGSGFRLLLPQGGSTLTQQLVRGYFLQDRTSYEAGEALFRESLIPRILSAGLGARATNKLLRKLEEVRLALWLEEEMRRRYGSREQAKREIFARSASFHYLGNGRYGFAAASEYYFGKPLSSYTTEDAGEAALLAGIIKSPGVYAPVARDPRPRRRRNEILALMARNGYIPESLAERCRAKPIRVAARSQVKTHAPTAIENVLDELKQYGVDRFGIEDLFQGRISIRSTLDERVQTIVNEALEKGLARYEKRHPWAKGFIQGSVVALRNGNAAILAEAGGRHIFNDRDARYSDYNRVTGSLRQPGSAWKPLVYLAAFRQGLDLATTVPDEPIEVSMGADQGVKWISNYDNQFKGPIPIRQALAESRNTVAVWITREIGLNNVIRTARGAADLSRDHAPRLPGQTDGARAAFPPRDRGRDRRVPGNAGLDGSEARQTAAAGLDDGLIAPPVTVSDTSSAYWVPQLWENSRSHLPRGIIPGGFHTNRCYSAPAGGKRTTICFTFSHLLMGCAAVSFSKEMAACFDLSTTFYTVQLKPDG